MSLEQRLTKTEQVLAESIGKLVKDVTKTKDYYENNRNYGYVHQDACNFLESYKNCAWKGQVSGELLQYLQQHLIDHAIQNRSSAPMLLFMAGLFGFGAAGIFYKYDSLEGAMLAGGAGAISWLTAIYKTQKAANYAKLLYEGLNNPDAVQNALKHLYQTRSKNG